MALINTSLPNLIGGVSQQPDVMRYDGQCELQENALSSVVDGLTKRPNTRHVARILNSAVNNGSFVHFINRDDTEKYVVIHDGSVIKAWNLSDGTPCTINGASSYSYTPSTNSYLDTATPRSHLKALTIADSTILLNTNYQVAEDFSSTSADVSKNIFAFVKQGDYSKQYKIIFSEQARADISYSSAITGGLYGNNQPPFYYSNTITFNNGGGGYEPSTIIRVPVDTSGSGSTNIQYPNAAYLLRTNSSGIIDGVGLTFNQGTTPEAQAFSTTSFTFSSSSVPIRLVVPDPTTATPTDLGQLSETTESASFESSSGVGARTTRIVSQLVASASQDLLNQFEITSKGNGIHFEKRATPLNSATAVEDVTVRTEDDLAGEGLGIIYKSVDSISDLPLTCKNNFKTKVTGDVEINADDFYVKFETSGGGDWNEGSWAETLGFGVTQKFLSSSMPHQLINTGVNTFTLGEATYSDRTVGDNDSVPMPSFVGGKINGMFLFKNRLGFLSGENVSISESGNLFNFFRTTVTTLLDSDPIDVAVSSSRVTNLKSAKGFQENLILFAENGQFVLKGGDVLTPKTVSITPVTNFDFDESVEPIPLGAYIYFPFTRSGFTGVREFTVNSTTDVYDSVEVTEHVPRYVPNNLTDFAGSTNEDILALVSDNEKGSIYLYKYFFNGSKKVLSSWFKFTFDGEVRGIEFIDSVLYIILTKNSETHLLELPLTSGLADSTSVNHTTLLDMRLSKTVTSGSNTISLSGNYTPDINSIQVYTTDGLRLNCTNDASTITLTQPVSANTNVFIGIPYTMKYTFSEQLFKAQSGQAKTPSASAKLLIRNGAVFFSNTAFFVVKVTPKFRDSHVNTFTTNIVGSTVLGALNTEDGFFRFPVFSKAEDTTISIENNSALPSNFSSAEFESFTHSRSNRYG